MRTRIIAVLNQKGGVGKTTTCVSLGAALARRGHRVLLIDMDPQSNLTVHLGADTRAVRKSTYSLLLGEHPLGPAVLPTRDPNLRYVPATLALANAEIQLASAVGRELLLREAIEVWLEDESAGEPVPRADFVFIDCPPSLGILTMNALCAAGEVLLPIQAEFFALQGVAGILESLKAVQRLNRGLRLTMVVPCMVDRRKTLAREVMEEVDKYFGKLVTRTRIRNNVKLAEAPSHGMTIYEYDPSSNGAKDYESLAREVLGEPLDADLVPDAAPAEPATASVEPRAAAADEPPATASDEPPAAAADELTADAPAEPAPPPAEGPLPTGGDVAAAEPAALPLPDAGASAPAAPEPSADVVASGDPIPGEVPEDAPAEPECARASAGEPEASPAAAEDAPAPCDPGAADDPATAVAAVASASWGSGDLGAPRA